MHVYQPACSRVILQLRPASGRANSDKAIICLCDISPEYRLTGRPSVIRTARRRDHGRAATHVCTPYQMSRKQRRRCSLTSSISRRPRRRPLICLCQLTEGGFDQSRAGQKRKIGTFIYRLVCSAVPPPPHAPAPSLRSSPTR